MKRKICIVLALIILAIVAIFIYWFKRGDACLTQPPYFNCHTQNKLDDIDNEINNLSGQILSLNEPSIFNIDKYEVGSDREKASLLVERGNYCKLPTTSLGSVPLLFTPEGKW